MDVNTAQWMWYFYNFMEDRKESFETRRDLVEYHASFIEPEMVSKIVEQREKGTNIIGTTDDKAFSKSVGQIFGRDPNLPSTNSDQGDGEVHEVSDLLDRVKAYEKEQATFKKDKLPYNYKHWSEFNLE